MTPDSLTILDWGASHFAGAVFSRTRKSSLKLEAWACEERTSTTGNDPSARLDAEAAAWGRIRRGLGGSRRAVLSLPSPPVSVAPIAVAMLDRRNTRRALEFEGTQALGKSAEGRSRVYFHAGSSKGKSDWIMASIERAEIDRCVNLLEKVGFAIEAAIPQVATLHALLEGRAKVSDRSLALVQIGTASTRFLYLEEGHRILRILPVGGNTLARILGDDLSLPLLEAEQLKRRLCSDARAVGTPRPEHFGGARGGLPDPDKVSEAFRRGRDAFSSRLQLELTRAIVNQRNPAGVGAPVEIWLVGEESCAPDLCTELAEKLGLSVRRIEPAAVFERSDSVPVLAGIDQDRCVELAGVGRTLLFENPEGLNLLGNSRSRAAAIARRQPLMIGIAALAAASLVPPMISLRNAAVAAGRRAGEIDDEVHALERNRVRIAGNLKKIEQAGAEIARWRSFSAARGNWVRFLSELQARLSGAGDMWLDHLQLLGGAGVSSPSVGSRMVMSGRVLEQPQEASASAPSAEARVRTFLEAMSASPFVAAFEQERFDRSLEGILGFEVVLRMNRSETL